MKYAAHFIPVLLFLCFWQSAYSQIRSIERASVDSNGVEGNLDSDGAVIDGSGDLVAFRSDASNFVVNDGNSSKDVFLRDISQSTTTLISFGIDAGSGNNDSGLATDETRPIHISDNGVYIAFASRADDLVSGDSNGAQDVFVYDSMQQSLSLRSVIFSSLSTSADSEGALVSDDGDVCVFSSLDTGFATNDQNGASDVIRRSEFALNSEVVSTEPSGDPGNAASSQAAMSSDGILVTFASNATDLVAGDTNGRADVFFRDNTSRTIPIELISQSAGGQLGNGDSFQPHISTDGRFIVFVSEATNLVSGDTNSFDDIYLRDRQLGTTERISVSRLNKPANGHSKLPSVSSDGRFVAYLSDATNIVKGDTNQATDVFVRDRTVGRNYRVSLTSDGVQASAAALDAFLSSGGSRLVFSSADSTLVKSDNNSSSDVFVVEIKPIITPDTPIEDPPSVSVTDSTVVLGFLDFSGVSFKSNATARFQAFARSAARSAARAKKNRRPNVLYKATLTDAANTIKKYKSKKSSLTIRDLAPGTYSASYTVVLRRGRKKISESDPSPSVSFTFPNNG